MIFKPGQVHGHSVRTRVDVPVLLPAPNADSQPADTAVMTESRVEEKPAIVWGPPLSYPPDLRRSTSGSGSGRPPAEPELQNASSVLGAHALLHAPHRFREQHPRCDTRRSHHDLVDQTGNDEALPALHSVVPRA